MLIDNDFVSAGGLNGYPMQFNSEVSPCPASSKSSEALWAAFKNGDRKAFAILYQRYFKILLHYGMRIASDRDLVKDSIQDLFVEIWRTRENLSYPNSVKAYMLSSIQRKLVRTLNQGHAQQNRLLHLRDNRIAPMFSTEDKIIKDQLDSEQNDVVSKALDSLTKRQREAVYLKFYAGLSYKEIAELMTISVDSIYNLISKAVVTLQKEIIQVRDNSILVRSSCPNQESNKDFKIKSLRVV